MLGFRRRSTAEQETQIPYQVYETVNEPAARRQRWILRLLLALVVATLLVAGLFYLRHYLESRSGSGSGAPAQSQHVQQAPQTNTPLPQAPGEPAKLPASDSTNDKVVDQPQ